MLSTTAATTWLLTALLTSMATDPAAGDACASTPAAVPLVATVQLGSPPSAGVPFCATLSTIVPPTLLAAPPSEPAARAGDPLTLVLSLRAVHLPEFGPLLLLIGGAVLMRPARRRPLPFRMA